VATPRAASVSETAKTVLHAPRALNAPTFGKGEYNHQAPIVFSARLVLKSIDQITARAGDPGQHFPLKE
jgi:hypothetical protein